MCHLKKDDTFLKMYKFKFSTKRENWCDSPQPMTGSCVRVLQFAGVDGWLGAAVSFSLIGMLTNLLLWAPSSLEPPPC